MKKNLLFACVLTSLVGSTYAQLPVSTTPANKNVYLEEFTGIKCGYCPDGHRIGTQIHDADPTRVVLVNVHSGGFANPSSPGQIDFRTTPGTAIDGMSGMGITGYPAGDVNRKVLVGSVMAASRGSWTSMAATIKSQPAYCNVACQGTLDPSTRVLTVDVEVYYTSNSPVTTNSINVFLLENKIAGYQSNYGSPLYNLANYNEDGTYNHNHVLRASLTGNFGSTIPNTTSGTLYTGTFTYTIPATYGASGYVTAPNFENLELVAFVAQSDRDVINVANGPLKLTKDAKAKALDLDGFVCGNNISPVITIENTGLTAITDLTITPSIDNVAKATTVWTGNLASGATTTVALNSISASTGGGHAFSYVITGDSYTANNSGKGNYYAAANYQGTPVSEGFSVTTFPPASWAVINDDNGKATWSRKSGTNVGGFNLSSQCAKYDFFKNTAIGDKDEMYLPPIDLSGADAPEISFDIAYAQRTFSSNDMIEVKASDDCGATWTTIYTNGGSALTNMLPTPNEYSPNPNDASEWRTEAAALTGFNKNDVIVKFVTTSDNGNNMYIDNINLAQKSPTGISKVSMSKMSVAMFPNPSNGVTSLKINAAKAGEAKVSVINTLGQVVSEKQTTLTDGYNSLELNVSDLATGIYNVSIETTGGTVVKKLTVIK